MISINQRGSLVFKRETTASIIMAHGFEFYFTLFIFVNIFLLIPCHLPEKIVKCLSIVNIKYSTSTNLIFSSSGKSMQFQA